MKTSVLSIGTVIEVTYDTYSATGDIVDEVFTFEVSGYSNKTNEYLLTCTDCGVHKYLLGTKRSYKKEWLDYRIEMNRVKILYEKMFLPKELFEV